MLVRGLNSPESTVWPKVLLRAQFTFELKHNFKTTLLIRITIICIYILYLENDANENGNDIKDRHYNDAPKGYFHS